jgi:hypothetical protein
MTDLDPAIVGEPLWTLRKDGHSAEARVRAIAGIGLELRFDRRGVVLLAPFHRVGAAGAGGAGEARGFRGERVAMTIVCWMKRTTSLYCIFAPATWCRR